jgi:hypothetical protein
MEFLDTLRNLMAHLNRGPYKGKCLPCLWVKPATADLKVYILETATFLYFKNVLLSYSTWKIKIILMVISERFNFFYPWNVLNVISERLRE